MTHLFVEPLSILLRKRLPQTAEEWNFFIGMMILFAIYILFKEKVLSGLIKWIFSTLLCIGSIIGLIIVKSHGQKFFAWCLTGAFFYCIIFELAKKFTINRRGVYYPPGEEPSKKDLVLTKDEELDINKIAIVLLVVWLIAGYFITRKL